MHSLPKWGGSLSSWGGYEEINEPRRPGSDATIYDVNYVLAVWSAGPDRYGQN